MLDNLSEFTQIIELAKIDKELNQLSSEKENLISYIENIELEIENIQKNIEFLYNKIRDYNKKLSILESELKLLDQKENSKKINLNNVSTTKEYYCLLNEIKDIKEEKDSLENNILNLLDQIKELENSYQNSLCIAKEKKEELIKDLNGFEKRIKYLEKEINLILNNKENLISKFKIDIPEILERYNSLKEIVPNPAVNLNKDSCSACFYKLTLNELSKIKENKLIECQNCRRFIYL